LTAQSVIGIIGGSGLYEFSELSNQRWERGDSPFGEVSEPILRGEIEGQPVIFLSRHGRGHRTPPSDINFRANIDVLKRAGVTDILAIGAVGSLREDLPPGTFVIVDQFVDRTFARVKSFFGSGLVAHVSMARPVCHRLGGHLEDAGRETGLPVRQGGTCLVMEGPQFSTLAESKMYRSWGCDVVGMTNMPEAKLAREAEICYAAVAMVTDYDCWHPEHDSVTVAAVVRMLQSNVNRSRDLVRRAVPRLRQDDAAVRCACRSALEHALVTPIGARDAELVARLDAVAGRIFARERTAAAEGPAS
jgi:5'-methylthioadenosine phosphorylase